MAQIQGWIPTLTFVKDPRAVAPTPVGLRDNLSVRVSTNAAIPEAGPPVAAAQAGRSLGDLLRDLYPELRRRAGAVMRRERSGHTLQPTALVSEVILRLLGDDQAVWEDDRQFLLRASQHMDRILIDYARKRRAAKRNNGLKVAPLTQEVACAEQKLEQVIWVAEALAQLRETDQRSAQIAVMRYLMDLSEKETAGLLGISVKTVERDWQFARAWLRAALARSGKVS
jgi:RNA polymerase sigma factor (TIGR02999 family)